MNTSKLCAITGTSGYLGGRLKDAVQKAGWQVLDLNRRAGTGSQMKTFKLGDDVTPDTLAGVHALVHAAYDFKQLSWADIQATNVAGSERLFSAAKKAGVEKIVYISSISAFEGCRSLYGKAKLETERIAVSYEATAIRPGLVWGAPTGAMMAKLREQVQKSRFQPLMGGGRQIQYMVHHEDIGDFVCRCIENRVSPAATPVTIAHEQPWTFRQVLEEIARVRGKRLTFIPLPWRLVWLAIKTAETAGVRLSFRSDSLVSLMYQNPSPSFAEQRSLGVSPRAFAPANL
jgi:nucleoside-diphosphate-sugar epimerase